MMVTQNRRRTRRRWTSEDLDLQIIDAGRLRRARLEMDYSQRDLGFLVGCSQAAISAMETGELTSITEKLALMIAKRLRKPLGHLFEAPDPTVVPLTTSAADDTGQVA